MCNEYIWQEEDYCQNSYSTLKVKPSYILNKRTSTKWNDAYSIQTVNTICIWWVISCQVKNENDIISSTVRISTRLVWAQFSKQSVKIQQTNLTPQSFPWLLKQSPKTVSHARDTRDTHKHTRDKQHARCTDGQWWHSDRQSEMYPSIRWIIYF